MTGRAIARCGQNSRVRRMTGETRRVPGRHGFESSFFEPERIAQFRGRFGHVFVFGSALRLVGLMANHAAVSGARPFEPRIDEHRAAESFFRVVPADDLDMFIVRKRNCKIRGGGGFAFRRPVENLARVRKRVTRTALRRRIRVTNRTNRGFRAFKELLAMTVQTGFVPRIFRDVGKRFGFSDGFPVWGRKFMTRITLHFMLAVRKLGIFRLSLLRCSRLRARLDALLRADGKHLRCHLRIKNPARQKAQKRGKQRGADFIDSF